MEPSKEMLRAVDQALQLMAATLANPRQITPQFTRIWATTLGMAGIRADEIEEGAARLMVNSKFFPSPAEFIEILRPKIDDDLLAESAWQSALDLVRRFGGYASLSISDAGGDGRILWTLDRMGWDRVCRELDDENRQFFRAEFVRLFRLAVSERAEVRYIAGRCERENTARGKELSGALCGRPEWKELPEERAARQEALPEVTALVRAL